MLDVEIIAIALTIIVHIVGAVVLVWALLDGEKIDWRGLLWPGEDDGDGGDWPDPAGDGPDDGGGVRELPIPDGAAPSPVRLREPKRLREAYPRPARRPEHAPEHPRPRVPSE